MSTAPRVPSIPEVRVADPAAQRVLEAVKALLETREGQNDPLDKVLTVRDLVNLGLAEARVTRNGRNVQAAISPTVTGPEDSSYASIPPPEPINVGSHGGIGTVMIEWTTPTYPNHKYTEVWRASVSAGDPAPAFDPTSPQVVRVSTEVGSPYADAVDAGAEERDYYYWLRNVSSSGLFSGVVQAPPTRPSVDPGYIISVLLGENSPFNTGDPLMIEVPEPTTVNGQDVPAGIYIRDLFVQNGTITSAKIGYAQIRDAHITDLTANKITTGILQASESITVDGAVMGGKNAYGSSTAGFWLGKDGANYKFSIGSASGYMRWTGTQLEISGNLDSGTITTTTISASEFINGNVRSGKTSYADTTAGYWLGVDGSTGKFHIGDALNYMRWTGAALEVRGLVTTSVLTANLMTGSVLDNSNTLIAPELILDPAYIPGLGGRMFVAAEGQDLDDASAVPSRLCYPAKLLDTSAAALDSSDGGTVYYFAPEPFTGEDSLRKFAEGIDPFWITTPYLIRRLRSGSPTPENYKLVQYDDPEDTQARAAKPEVTVRIRITDRAIYAASGPTFDTGTAVPPHWRAGRYLKVYIVDYYDPGGFFGPVTNIVATLDLSSKVGGVIGTTYSLPIAAPLVQFTQSALWSDTDPVVDSAVFDPVVGEVLTKSDTEQEEWGVEASYTGAGGDITVTATRTLPYTTGRKFQIFADVGGNFFTASVLNYTWNHLTISLEVEADNRPFTQDTIVL